MMRMLKTIFGILLATIRISLFVLWSSLCVVFGYVFLFLHLKTNAFLHIWWKLSNRIFGLKLKVVGQIDKSKKIIYVSNHISYWDIFAYGEALNPTFISKTEVRKWPVIGYLSDKFARLYFMDRRPSAVKTEKENINNFLKTITRSMMFFPEGTTTDGSCILPFRGALFENFLEKDVDICLCFIEYKKISGIPVKTKAQRRVHAWYNDPDLRLEDISLFKSMFKAAMYKNFEVQVKQIGLFNMKKITDRKEITKLCEKAILKEFKD